MSLASSISGGAEADLTRQYQWYVNNDRLEVAENFLEAFHSTILRLQRNPSIGRRRRFRSLELQGLRSFAMAPRFSSHLIFYRADSHTVSIERVMYGGRDLPKRLLEA